MENQHKLIKGYRDLSPAEVALMNEIKAHGEATQKLIDKVNDHLGAQVPASMNAAAGGQTEAQDRIDIAEPRRWAAMARTDLQVGIMKLVRAVAQPTSF